MRAMHYNDRKGPSRSHSHLVVSHADGPSDLKHHPVCGLRHPKHGNEPPWIMHTQNTQEGG
jgi:hypothetical protein